MNDVTEKGVDAAGTALAQWIVATALECGADLAGVGGVDELKRSPSHRIYPLLDRYSGVGTTDTVGREPGQVDWPEDAVSVVAIAVRHPEAEPELDWWHDGYSGGTEGNHRLMDVSKRLARRLADEQGIAARPLAYHIEHGGLFLKDVAALTGLGTLGRSNMLVTPEYGPRVRLRCLTIDRWAASTGPSAFDPCAGCAMPCRACCPQAAMGTRVHTSERYGFEQLPGRDGRFDRIRCNVQMEDDEAHRESITRLDTGETGGLVRYCRRCELACWVGEGA